jgi:hypothetical protein
MKLILPTLQYEKAPPGSPDKYVLTADAHFVWTDPPAWIHALAAAHLVAIDSGYVVAYVKLSGRREIAACVYRGFFFAISVAPSFPRALPAGCLHDWMYQEAARIAAHWGCEVRDVLHAADHWFLALMRTTGFGLSRTYFVAVRMLGYWFNKLCAGRKTA